MKGRGQTEDRETDVVPQSKPAVYQERFSGFFLNKGQILNVRHQFFKRKWSFFKAFLEYLNDLLPDGAEIQIIVQSKEKSINFRSRKTQTSLVQSLDFTVLFI